MHSMQQTRWEILQFLKRNSSASIEELALALSLASMTVRQHLGVLEREGLVRHTEQRKGPGRPSHRFSLRPQAEDLFPKGYDKLAERLLRELSSLTSDEIDGLSEKEKIAFIMQRMAKHVADGYLHDIRGTSINERVPEVIALLREREGTLSEWISDPDGYTIQDINCPYQNVAQMEPSLCTWHVNLLSRMLQTGVQVEQCMASGDNCCRYRLKPENAPPWQQMRLPIAFAPFPSLE